MIAFVARRASLLCLLALLLHASVTTAAPTAQSWEELGGSASGLGISASVRGVVPEHRNVSVAIGPDGRPVVAYTDWDAIVVKRWTGVEWELVGVPGSGHVPQIAFDSRGRMVVAWLQWIPPTQSWEAYLVVREPGGADWEALGGSDSGGGISGAEGPTNSTTMALALAPDGTPYVAYDTFPTRGADFTRVGNGIAADREQIYVKALGGSGAGLGVRRLWTRGRPLGITHTIRNLGPAPAGAFVIRFYLSPDDVLDPGDVLLGTRSVAALAAGASSAAITTVTVPATTVVPAIYRVIAVADALEQQVELEESNNVTVSATLAMTAYRPEILVTMLTAPVVVQAGRPMAITHTVRNAGPAPAGPFVIRFFLSLDDRPDAGDVLLGTGAIGSLGAGLSSTAATSVTVPANVASGTYRIIAVADAAGQQAELDETNDVTVSPPLSVAR